MNTDDKKNWLTPWRRLIIGIYAVAMVASCVIWVPWMGTYQHRYATNYAPIWSPPDGGSVVDTTRVILVVFVVTIVFGSILLIAKDVALPKRISFSRKGILCAAPVIVLLALAVLWLSGAFVAKEVRAQKLFDQGKYEEIIQKYTKLPIAKRAKDKVAEKMLAEGKYEEILAYYFDTPSSEEATNKVAEKLVAEKKYDKVLMMYPNTPAANMARNAMAEQLYADRKWDELVAKYPNTPAGVKTRNAMARVEFNAIMKKPKSVRKAKLEEFLMRSKFAGTEAAMFANEELERLSGRR